MRAMRSFVPAALFAAALSGTRAAQPPFARPEAPDACALISRPGLQAVIGFPLQQGIARLKTETVASCSFAAPHGSELAVLIRRLPAPGWAAEQIVRMKRGVALGTYREVPGIWRRAFFRDMHRAGAILCVFGARYYLQVSLIGTEDGKSVLEDLGARALARLESTAGPAPSAALGKSFKPPLFSGQ